MKKIKRWKFLREGLKSEHGNLVWDKKWKKHEGTLDMCSDGFHCSKEIYQAFSYVQGEILSEVEVKGKHLSEKDKEVWSEMRIIKCWKWQKKDSVALSIYAAELCLNNFEKVYPNDKRPREAIEAAKKWLENPTEKNQSAAASAAWSAWLAAESAAKSAWLAAESAESAAKSATRSAAKSAWLAAKSAAKSAKSALIKKISKWFDERKLEKYE